MMMMRPWRSAKCLGRTCHPPVPETSGAVVVRMMAMVQSAARTTPASKNPAIATSTGAASMPGAILSTARFISGRSRVATAYSRMNSTVTVR